MIMLAIESSCDETSAAIIKGDDEVLSNVVSSQIETHKAFGGVFPEVASRLHVEQINLVIKKAVEDAGVDFKDIEAIAFTQGPGLIGSLHVGVMAAKSLAFALDVPLVPVHHIAGHIYANKLVGEMQYPVLSLVISGGHTELVYMKSEFEFEILGQTQDDAVGEAYDKVARQLGLSYPGGPIIDKLAKTGKKNYILPKTKTDNPLDFSFSGLKSAVRQLTLREERNDRELIVEDVAYAFQERVVEQLFDRVNKALETVDVKTFALAGGVAANSLVRTKAESLEAQNEGLSVLIPPLWACMDQAAMIGLAGVIAYRRGIRADYDISAKSNIKLSDY